MEWLEERVVFSGDAFEVSKEAVIAPAPIELPIFDSLPGLSEQDGLFVLEDFRCLLYTSPSPRDATLSRMPSSA